ncbi:MAG: hypothetical protein R2880_09065 [Deinococcales bacterium]
MVVMTSQSSRYEIEDLLATYGAVSTYRARDTLSDLPVRYYQFIAEPVEGAHQLLSAYIPDILSIRYEHGISHVITAYSASQKGIESPIRPEYIEALLLDSAQALDDACEAGVIHGDIRPERLRFDGGQYLIEGYGVRWELKENKFSAPEKQHSFAADVYSWAKTMKALLPQSLSSDIEALLQSCLSPKPQERPSAEMLIQELSSIFLMLSFNSKHPAVQALKQTIMEAQPSFIDNLFKTELPIKAVETKIPEAGKVWAKNAKATIPDAFRITDTMLAESVKEGLGVESQTQADGYHQAFAKTKQEGKKRQDRELSETRPSRWDTIMRLGKHNSPRIHILALSLSLTVVAFGGLMWWQRDSLRQQEAIPSFTGMPASYPIYPHIVPDPSNLTGVSFIVVKSPATSRYVMGSEFGYSGMPLALDARGEWQLQARSGQFLSDIVSFDLPRLGAQPLVFNFESLSQSLR